MKLPPEVTGLWGKIPPAAKLIKEKRFKYCGVPIIKSPNDLMSILEVLWETKPDVFVETGTCNGGSALFYAHMFDVIGNGRVVSIDIQPLGERPTHPRITYLTGNSIAVGRSLRLEGKVAVTLDSDHTSTYVKKELDVFGPMVTPGQYLIVEDGVIGTTAGPIVAIREWFPQHPEFEPDRLREKFGYHFLTEGFWKRKAL